MAAPTWALAHYTMLPHLVVGFVVAVVVASKIPFDLVAVVE